MTLQFIPRIVQRELCHLGDLIPPFEESTCGFVPQAVKMEIRDS